MLNNSRGLIIFQPRRRGFRGKNEINREWRVLIKYTSTACNFRSRVSEVSPLMGMGSRRFIPAGGLA